MAEAKRKFENLKSELVENTSLERRRQTRSKSVAEEIADDDELNDNDESTASMLRMRRATTTTTTDAESTKPGLLTNVLNNANEGAQSITQRLLEKNRERRIRKKQFRKVYDLKLALSEFYLSLVLLQNYQNLNFTGFKKILKKHDKVT